MACLDRTTLKVFRECALQVHRKFSVIENANENFTVTFFSAIKFVWVCRALIKYGELTNLGEIEILTIGTI